MSHSTQDSSSAPGQAALTPLLDTLFLLLFAVLASSDEKAARSDAAEVQVELPSVDDAEDGGSVDALGEPVVVIIEADGRLSVEGDATPLAVPQDLAAVAGLDQSDVRVEIRAHSDARHAVVVEVLHELQTMGATDVRFVATRRDAATGEDAR